MALQKLIKFGAIAFGKPRRLRDITLGNFEELHQVFAFKPLACLVERGELLFFLMYRIANQVCGNNRRGAQRDSLFHHIE